jgi:hypothetical protein
MSPNEFDGNCMRGRAFLNLCRLYTALFPHQFTDGHAKIMWALSFMKEGLAACFVDRHMQCYGICGIGCAQNGEMSEHDDRRKGCGFCTGK